MGIGMKDFSTLYNTFLVLNESEVKRFRISSQRGEKKRLQVALGDGLSVKALRQSEAGLSRIEDNVFLRTRLLSGVRECLTQANEKGELVFRTPETQKVYEEAEAKLLGGDDTAAADLTVTMLKFV